MSFLQGLVEGLHKSLSQPVAWHEKGIISTAQRIYQKVNPPKREYLDKDGILKDTQKVE